jgi:poly-gamma-glutamate capsule biosynthesis protein CapA/YwtB (metallophosphatase superfamily)
MLAASLAGRPSSPPEERVSVIIAGDIMLDLLPGEDIARGKDPFADFAEWIDRADLAVGNLECVVATKGTRIDKPWTFRAHPSVLKILGKHFHAVSLANNHTGDFGHDAFVEQLEHLRRHKIGYFGGGKNTTEARTPWLVEKKGIRIAFLGYNDFQPRAFEAGPHWPGVAWAVEAQMIADLRAARDLHKADIVIPYLHWGWEDFPANRKQKKLARALIDHGADFVVGAHPHVTQGAEYYKNKLIVYSLGNCVFDGFDTDATRTGWFLRIELTKAGVQSWSTLPLWLDERGTPKRLPNVATPWGRADDPLIRTGPALDFKQR